MKRHRFKVIEYASHYAVLDSKTGEERAMSDGVDVLFTPTGCSMRPGSEYFRRTWEASLNHNPDETFEAYFDIDVSEVIDWLKQHPCRQKVRSIY